MSSSTQTVREFTREQQTPISEFEQCETNNSYSSTSQFYAKARCTTKPPPQIEGDIAALEAEPMLSDLELESWTGQSLASLSSHIVTCHHAYTKRELPRLAR